jgi:hypothetical protein
VKRERSADGATSGIIVQSFSARRPVLQRG